LEGGNLSRSRLRKKSRIQLCVISASSAPLWFTCVVVFFYRRGAEDAEVAQRNLI